MTKFKDLLKDLNIDDKLTKRVNKPESFNHVKDNVPLVANYNMMADILFLPTAKFGYKYLFVIVDLANDAFEIQEIKNKEPETILKAMKACFNRGFIKEPKYSLKTDAGNEFKGAFHKYLYDKSIMHKIALPNRHQSLSNVESLNRQIGRILNLLMNDKEKKTGKKFSDWVQFVPLVREKLNAIRIKKLPKNINTYEYPVPDTTKEITEKKGKKEVVVNILKKPKFRVGQLVHRYLERPKNALGKNQPTTNRREGDINFETEAREIIKIFVYSGNPTYRYYLDGLRNVSFTENQLILA